MYITHYDTITFFSLFKFQRKKIEFLSVKYTLLFSYSKKSAVCTRVPLQHSGIPKEIWPQGHQGSGAPKAEEPLLHLPGRVTCLGQSSALSRGGILICVNGNFFMKLISSVELTCKKEKEIFFSWQDIRYRFA